jgi:hypothetical protein
MRFFAAFACILAAHAPAAIAQVPPAGTPLAGWMKTFATGEIGADDPFEAPDYLGDLTEAAARDELKKALLARGLTNADAPMTDILTFSVKVEAPKPKGPKPLPKSPVRLQGVDDDPTDNIHDPEVRPYITLDPKKPAKTAAPELKVTILARRGDERVWTGYAGAALEGASRENVARALVRALVDKLGEASDVPDAAFDLSGQGPVSEIVRN